MRPPAKRQDPLRAPLNDIFGSKGSVRVLRVLAFSGEPIGRTAVARRAQLNPSGVRRTLDRLAELGVVEAIGSGRTRSVRLRERHPLCDEIRSLYERERSVWERFVNVLRDAVDERDVPARAVWLESPEGRAPGTAHIGVLSTPEGVDEARRAVEARLGDVEHDLATQLVVHGYTKADQPALSEEEEKRLQDVTLLHGWLPHEWWSNRGGPVRLHRYLDDTARRLSERIAEMLPQDPSIVDRALRWLEGQLQEAGDREAPDLHEWRNILENLSLQQIQAVLKEDSERADRLRQSLPFVEVLTPEERRKIFGGRPE